MQKKSAKMGLTPNPEGLVGRSGPLMPPKRQEKFRNQDRPAGDRVLRTIRNLSSVGFAASEIGWMFELPPDLVRPVVEDY